MDKCTQPAASRRRYFWATQPDACGVDELCRQDCGIPGLQLLHQGPDGTCSRCTCSCPGIEIDPECLAHNRATRNRYGATIATNDWIRSLLLNIFNTYARAPNNQCGLRPGAQGGHWSESYRDDGLTSGTSIYYVPSSSSINDAVKLLNATASKDAQRLVQLGVAIRVEVDVVYLGNNMVSVTIDVYGPDSSQGRVNLSATMIDNAWVWS